VNKPGKSFPRPLAEVLHRTLNAAFAKQGFASTEIVTRWADIVGADIADHSEPEKILWSRPSGADVPEPGVLVLRVEGPVAIEIQHLSGVVLERVNRFFGWRAVGALRLRQAPLSRRKQTPQRPVDKDAAARVAAHLTEITDENLRAALARLGAALKES
jgi:hypothetical protein